MSIALEATPAGAVACRPWACTSSAFEGPIGAPQPEYAVRRAREIAFADGITVFGDPTVSSKRVPIPVIGPRREFLVTFPRATRRP